MDAIISTTMRENWRCCEEPRTNSPKPLRLNGFAMGVSVMAIMSAFLLSCLDQGKAPANKDQIMGKKQTEVQREVEVQGHRGARWNLPESTIEGFLFALESGADTLELDLNVTADDVLVIHHDQLTNPELCRYRDSKKTLEKKPIRSMMWAELKDLDCGSLAHPRFPHQTLLEEARVLRLEDLFESLENSNHPRAKTIHFNIEAKSNAEEPEHQPTPAHFAELILSVLKKYKVAERSCIQSFDHRVILEVKKISPFIKTAALFGEAPDNWLDEMKKWRADILSPRFTLVSKELVKKLHDENLILIPWTVNEEKDWDALIEMGVDGIITDRPADLVQHLRK